MKTKLALFAASIACTGIAGAIDGKPGEAAPENVAGKPFELKVSGSDTMLQISLGFADAYKEENPNIRLNIQGAGSAVGIKDLLDGEAHLANSSRPIKDSEIAKYKEKFGAAPQEHIIGYDVIAIYAHPDNPAKSISLEQLKTIYGDGGDTAKWSDVVPGNDAKVAVFGRSNLSGTYAFFKKTVFARGEGIGKHVARLPGSKAVVDQVATNPAAIGYSGIGYKNDKVKCLSVTNADGEAVAPERKNVRNGSYPLRRPLYIYSKAGQHEEVARYLAWIKSRKGQAIVTREGFTPAF